MGAGHPECPERLDAIEDRLLISGLDIALERREATAAAMADLELAHGRMHLASLRGLSDQLRDDMAAGGPSHAQVDPDTSINVHSWDAILMAAGAAIDATDAIMAGQIKAGSYELPKGLTPRMLLDKLVRGEQAVRRYVAQAIRRALSLAGEVGPDRLVSKDQLSPRELEVIHLLAAGHAVGAIATQLNRSKQTVSAQKVSAMRKLGLASEAALYIYVQEHGLS